MPNHRVGWGYQFNGYAGPLGIIRDSAFWVLCRYRHSVHWTGARHRLGREFGKRFGDKAYAFEELVAELGAAFLCASVGLTYATRHSNYIGDWIRLLKDDQRAILSAAAKAQAAMDFILKTSIDGKNATEPAPAGAVAS